MATTRTLIKAGAGSATAALVGGTSTTVTLVTLPSNPDYEYELNITGYWKNASTGASRTILIGGMSYSQLLAGGTIGNVHGIFQTSSVVNYPGEYTTSGSNLAAPQSFNNSEGQLRITGGAGQAITAVLESSQADTYVLKYNYVGRKTLVEGF